MTLNVNVTDIKYITVIWTIKVIEIGIFDRTNEKTYQIRFPYFASKNNKNVRIVILIKLGK